STERSDDDAGWLDDHRSRLGLLVAAVHGVELPVRVAQPPAPPSMLRRLLQRLPRRLIPTAAVPATDDRHLFLPRRLAAGPLPAAHWFRLLALQQAGRAMRGSAGLADLPRAGLAHELYLLSEAA